MLARAVPEEVREICKRLHEAGYRGWVVGGCVRDLLLAGQRGAANATTPPGDWDIATSARPEQVQKLFRKVIPTGIKHGTVTVVLPKGSYEVTTLRGETSYSDGRRPDKVFFVDDISADLARRDFTINAIAYDPLDDRLIDPFDGQADLRRRSLRAVGNAAERFAEDGLRVLRAARFVATLEVELEPDTERAILPSLESYRKVSAERIREEWLKAMKAKTPSLAFEVMRQHGLLAISAPELLDGVGCVQERGHDHDVWQHTLRTVDACPRDAVLRVAALLHDVAKPRTRQLNSDGDWSFPEHDRVGAELAAEFCNRLRFSGAERDRIAALVQNHRVPLDHEWSDRELRHWLRRITPEYFGDVCALSRADLLARARDVSTLLASQERLFARARSLLEQRVVLTTKQLAVRGSDLIAELGLAPGPRVGALLAQLLERVVDDPALNERNRLLECARDQLEAPTGPN